MNLRVFCQFFLSLLNLNQRDICLEIRKVTEMLMNSMVFHEFFHVFSCKVIGSFSNLEEYKVFRLKLIMVLLFFLPTLMITIL